MRIDVTQHDIDNGLRGYYSSCPVALAICRVTGKSCKVSNERVYIENYCGYFDLPFQARQFIRAFDNNLSVKPFSFELDI